VKAHAGIYGNEIAAQLAKEATYNKYVSYSKIPKSASHKKGTITKWRGQWEETTKGANTKQFFPSVTSSLAVQLELSPSVTAIMAGHGNITAYLHPLKIIGSPECPCKHDIQTADHLIFQRKMLRNQREILKNLKEETGQRAKVN
jgi:hypothetical protein